MSKFLFKYKNFENNEFVRNFFNEYNIVFKYIILLFIFIIYNIFSSKYSTLDGYCYAFCVKSGDNLFFAHHLLYNYFNYLLYTVIKFFGISVDVLSLMKMVNALFAVFALSILWKLLDNISSKSINNLFWILFAAFSFGTIRFAIDVEAYIVPTVFSLMGSYLLTKNGCNPTRVQVLFASFFASFGCLFHQIHFFWWVSLLFYVFINFKQLKFTLAYILPAFIVPIVYLAVMGYFLKIEFTFQNFFHFVFHDYFDGHADVVVGTKGIVLAFINLIRTVFQVHGYMFLLFKNWNWLFSLMFISASGFLLASLYYIKLIRFKFSKSRFAQAHLLVLILQFIFAILSDGNAEFMAVMLFQIPIVASFYLSGIERAFRYFIVGLIIWNLSFALVPLHYFDMDGDELLANYINKRPEGTYILKNNVKISHILDYHYNQKYHTVQASTSGVNSAYAKEQENLIDSALMSGRDVITDAIDNKLPFSRESYLEVVDTVFYSKWTLVPCDTIFFLTERKILMKFELKSHHQN